MLNLREKYARTSCGCGDCVACCEHMPGSLIPGDLSLIELHMQPENIQAWLLDSFEASEGGTVEAQLPDGTRQRVQVPTIVPKKTETGCVFLKEGKCEIHEVAPFGCAYLDTHMAETLALERSLDAIKAQAMGWHGRTPYAAAWSFLNVAGNIAAPLVDRKLELLKATEGYADVSS